MLRRQQVSSECGPVGHLGFRAGICVLCRCATSYSSVIDILELLSDLINNLALAIAATPQAWQLRAYVGPPVTHDGTPLRDRARRRATSIHAAAQPTPSGPLV